MTTKDNLNASKYASALYDLAIEEKVVDLIYEQLLELQQFFYSEIEFLYWFKTIAVDNEKKKDCFKTCINPHIHWILANFFLYIIDKNDEYLILKIFKLLDEMLCKKRKVVKLNIISPFEITDDQKTRIESIVKKKMNKDVISFIKIDPNLIGGIRIEYNGKYYDGSIKSRLIDLKNELKKEV